MSVDVAPAGASRLPVMASVLARAFADDPMILWPLSPGPDVVGRIETMFALMYEPLIHEGVVWEVADARGFAVWIPPGAAGDMFENDARIRPLLAPLTDDGGARYGVLWDWIERYVPSEPVWYLDAIGVDPPHQAAGVGTALIRAGLRMAEDQALPAFLETAVERHVGYYERFGFAVVADGVPVEGGPHIWFMRKDPGS